jgi:hypothetical protein
MDKVGGRGWKERNEFLQFAVTQRKREMIVWLKVLPS